MPRLTNDERNQAIGMVTGGMSFAQVAMRMRVHRHTISRLISRHRRTDSVADRPRAGRPRVTTPAQDRYIRTVHLRYYYYYYFFFVIPLDRLDHFRSN